MINPKYKRIQELGWNPVLLRRAKVLVVGAGALGNEALKNLALLGVGHIWVADMDIIEDHNLTRSVLFRAEDIGKPKAEAAAHRIKEINPDVKVYPVTKTVQEAMGLGFFFQVQVVFGCVDNVQTRLDLNRYCLQAGTLFIDAGIRKLDGDVKIFGKPYAVCFDCMVTNIMRLEAWQRHSCLKLRSHTNPDAASTAPTIASIMAGLQVQVGVKYLHKQPIVIGKRFAVLGYIDQMHVTKMHRNQECPTHAQYTLIPKNQIIPLNLSSTKNTIAELLKEVKNIMGNNAVIQLDYDLVTHYTCLQHNYQTQLYRRRGTIFADEVQCPLCKQEQQPNAHLLMQEHFINQISGNEQPQLLQKKLNQIGLPYYHIVTGFTCSDNQFQYNYFLIKNDKKIFTPF